VLAIPVEAVLGHPLERRIVDIDDPEALRVAEAPLEVVEEAPDEVAADRRAGVARASDRVDVRLQVRDALRIVDGAVTEETIEVVEPSTAV